jgi:hypothetical protein
MTSLSGVAADEPTDLFGGADESLDDVDESHALTAMTSTSAGIASFSATRTVTFTRARPTVVVVVGAQ